ncbi:MAG: hypothetical protein GY839_05255 [candidate division Zixibacteria bacterium]|nr:hypothetical protein [candidate division Zixibacteria bacterium]
MMKTKNVLIMTIVMTSLALVALWIWESSSDDNRVEFIKFDENAAMQKTKRKDSPEVKEWAALRETKKWFSRNDIGFGHGWDSDLYCTPAYGESNMRYKIKKVDFNPKELITGDLPHRFYAYPESSLAEYFTYVPGDTVLIIWENGVTRAVIQHIGDFATECFSDVKCHLEMVDSTEIKPSGKFLVLMGKLANYDGPIVRYSEYQLHDSGFIATKDSLCGELDKAYRDDRQLNMKIWHPSADSAEIQELLNSEWEKLEGHYGKGDRIRTYVFGAKQPNLPDTLYLYNQCWYFSTESSWGSRYRLIRGNDTWQVETLGEPVLGGGGGAEIICALDLNGDGEFEFLGPGAGFIGLWMYFKNRTIRLNSSGYWGC